MCIRDSSNTYVKEYTYLGIVGEQNEKGLYRIEQRNKFSVGEEIEVMKPDGRDLRMKVRQILDEEGRFLEAAPHPKQVLWIGLEQKTYPYDTIDSNVERYDILRRQEEEEDR